MPKLRDYFTEDLSTFFNKDEFSDIAIIDHKEEIVLIDEERLKERGEKEYGGITTGMILYFIPVSSFSQKPKLGNSQVFNGRLLYVEDVRESSGIYEIIITQNRGE